MSCLRSLWVWDSRSAPSMATSGSESPGCCSYRIVVHVYFGFMRGNTRAAIPLMALVERGTHQDAQASVGLRARGFGSTARRVKAAGRVQVLTLRDRELGLLRVDPSEHYAWFLAKKAAAFFRMSRSMRNSRLSLRRRLARCAPRSLARSCHWSDPPGPARPSYGATTRSTPNRAPRPRPACPHRGPGAPLPVL